MDKKISLILNDVQSKLLQKKYSESTVRCYMDWTYRFLFFHKREEPRNYGIKEINQFLTFLDKERHLAPSSQNQAFNAIRFLYREIWDIPADHLSVRPKRQALKPTILGKSEINQILSVLSGEKWLMTALMYGCGLTASECLQIRIKDVDFKNRSIHILHAAFPRKTLFPKSLEKPLNNQIRKIESIYNENILLESYEGALISDKAVSNHQKAIRDLESHFLFPSKKLRKNEENGVLIQFPRSESYLQKAITEACKKISIGKNVSCITFRHSFATHLIENGCDIRLVQEMLGHKNLQSTMVYRELARLNFQNIKSPLDYLLEKEKIN